jgi:PAS domain-containing protein
MKKFVCEQNVAHFQKLLSETTDPSLQRTLQSLLSSAKRELAILNSTQSGADVLPFEHLRRRRVDTQAVRQQFQSEFEGSRHPYMLLDPGPGLYIVDINDAYAEAALITRGDVVGKSLFEIFPDNPDDALADGVSNLYASLQIVVETSQPHAMAIQRYDIRNPNGEFIERHWQPINTPLHNVDMRLIFLLHHVEDVTDQVLACRPEKNRVGAIGAPCPETG